MQSHEQLSQEAAERAVKKVFAILGVDVEKPESIEDFREDLRFGRRMRKLADQGMLAFVVVAVGGIAAAMWAGLSLKFGNH